MTQTHRYLTIKIDLKREAKKLHNGVEYKDLFFYVEIIDNIGGRVLFAEKIGKNFKASLRKVFKMIKEVERL